MQISHEVPLVLLEKSREFNDYDYALVHLFEKYPEYLKFYKESIKMGRNVLLDNSIFELEEAFDADKFAKWVLELTPTRYIIPDVLDDSEGTIKNLYNWLTKYSSLPGKKIGVVQGRTLKDIVKCYKEMSFHCDEIAISFNYLMYEENFASASKLTAWMVGRIDLLRYLEAKDIIRKDKPHHLLGCSLPQEFQYYKDIPWITSLDTSNPIVHGLVGVQYGHNGLDQKESKKLADLIESEVSKEQLKLINYNVNQFKKLVNG